MSVVDSSLSLYGGQGGVLVESPLSPKRKGELHTQQPCGKSVPRVSKTTLTLSSHIGLVGLAWFELASARHVKCMQCFFHYSI